MWVTARKGFRRGKSPIGNGIHNPHQHIVAGAALIIAKVMIEADELDLAGLKQGNGLIRPIAPFPAKGLLPRIIRKNMPCPYPF